MGEEGGGENIKKSKKKKNIKKPCMHIDFLRKQWRGLNASKIKLKFGLLVICVVSSLSFKLMSSTSFFNVCKE